MEYTAGVEEATIVELTGDPCSNEEVETDILTGMDDETG